MAAYPLNSRAIQVLFAAHVEPEEFVALLKIREFDRDLRQAFGMRIQ